MAAKKVIEVSVADLAVAPDEDLQVAFRVQLKKLLELYQELAAVRTQIMWRSAFKATPTQIVHNVRRNQNPVIGQASDSRVFSYVQGV